MTLKPFHMHLSTTQSTCACTKDGTSLLPEGWLVPHPDTKFHDINHFIQLKKNLYGCNQAAQNWFADLSKGFLKQGFRQSAIDPCHFLWKDYMMNVYTDDCLLFAQNDAVIDSLITALSKDFLLEDQGTIHDYLGIRIKKDPVNKTITISQPGLIKSTLSDLGLAHDSKSKSTLSWHFAPG